MRDAFSLYFYYCKTSMKAWFQYRVDAFLRIFAVMARESTAVIIMYIVFDIRNIYYFFHRIEGFSVYGDTG